MIVKEGWPFVIGFFLLGLVLVGLTPHAGLWSGIPGILMLLTGSFMLYFFRDPGRVINAAAGAVLSPADGVVMGVAQYNASGAKGTMIQIFLSVFNVHIQRAPVEGIIEQVVYKKGEFLPAFDRAAAERNEKNTVIIRNEKGIVEVSQIAGLLARRIVCHYNKGEYLARGQKYGLICFGSQVDVLMPESVNIKVSKGDHVQAGLTVIGEW